MRVNHALRGPASRIATVVWEEQGPNLSTSHLMAPKVIWWMRLSVGYPNAQGHDPFWVPSDAHPGKGKSQVVGGVLKAQVVGGEAKAGRGLDRDLKRIRTKVKILPS